MRSCTGCEPVQLLLQAMTSHIMTDCVSKSLVSTSSIKIFPEVCVGLFTPVQFLLRHASRHQDASSFSSPGSSSRVAVIYPHAELHGGSSQLDNLALVPPFSSVQRQSQSHLACTGAPQTNKSQRAQSGSAALWMQNFWHFPSFPGERRLHGGTIAFYKITLKKINALFCSPGRGDKLNMWSRGWNYSNSSKVDVVVKQMSNEENIK